MKILLGNWTGTEFRAILQERRCIGQLLSPAHWRQPASRHWACDNDVFGNRHNPDWWEKGKWIEQKTRIPGGYRIVERKTDPGEYAWLKMLDKVTKVWCDPLFCLLPDVVGDWPQTLERAHRYRRECEDRELPFAVALQDGCIFEQALDFRPSYVFIGGSTAWKWRTVGPACEYFQIRGIKVHVGRTSGPYRIRECLRLGVDSCDGTGWGRHSDKMLPGLWRELDGTNPQLRLTL